VASLHIFDARIDKDSHQGPVCDFNRQPSEGHGEANQGIIDFARSHKLPKYGAIFWYILEYSILESISGSLKNASILSERMQMLTRPWVDIGIILSLILC
jgi:hypothetical protein